MWNPEVEMVIEKLIPMAEADRDKLEELTARGAETLFYIICALASSLDVDAENWVKAMSNPNAVKKMAAKLAAASILARQEADEESEESR